MSADDTWVWGLLILSLSVSLYCLYWLITLKKRFRAAFANLGSDQNLADTIVSYFDKLGATAASLSNLQKSYKHLATIGGNSLQKVGVVRFNPFRDTGGDQSFVLALLDANDSGILMTSIHGREGTRVYIKPVEYGSSKHTLSAEEESALKAAKTPLPSRS